MQLETEILIIGGGLAGLTAALHLQKLNLKVILIEKNPYPNHKVCGEYISNEVLPYLNWLGISFQNLKPALITDLNFTSPAGKNISTILPLGGFGLSRYTMDNFLYQKLLERNIEVIFDTVCDVTFGKDSFTIHTTSGRYFSAKQVIGAFGKRSTVDVKLNRHFIRQKSPYLAVKAHYRGAFDPNVVALHNFKGGYCGVSCIENKDINICYLTDYQSFKKYKNIANFQEEVLYKNKFLKNIFENSEMLFETPLTISQISFEEKESVLNHMLLVGDTAGLIHPLCGNGMAMAIHSAKIASELIAGFLRDKSCTRAEMELHYTKLWNNSFKSRLRTGKLLSSVLSYTGIQELALNTIAKMPYLLGKIIKTTHGKPIPIPQ